MSVYQCPITHLRYVGIAVSNFDECVSFYQEPWGLELVHADESVAYFGSRAGGENYIVRVRASKEKRLDLFGYGARSAKDVDELAERLARANVRIDREPAELTTPGNGYGFRFFDCDGRLLEVSANVEQRPVVELDPKLPVPRRLSHGVVNSQDAVKTMEFYAEHLGFRLSDWLGDLMCFLRCGEQHHSLAIAKGPHVSLNHISFEMGNLDLFLRGTGKIMRAHGRKPIWGPGRHAAGDNAFSYFYDPAGNIVEYTTDLEIVDEDTWTVRQFDTTPEASDLWGTAGSPFDEMVPNMLKEVDPGVGQSCPM